MGSLDRTKFSIIFFIFLFLVRFYPLGIVGNELILKSVIEFFTLISILFFTRNTNLSKIHFFSFLSILLVLAIGSILNDFLLLPYNSVLDFYDYFKITLYFIFFIFLESSNDVDKRTIIKALKISFYLICLIVILNILSLKFDFFNKIFSSLYFQKSNSSVDDFRYRISGSFTNPNHFGLILVVFSFDLLKSKNFLFCFWSKLLVFIILIIGVYFTGSRTSLFVLLFSLLIFYFKKIKYILPFLALIIFSYASLDSFYEIITPRLKTTIDSLIMIGPLGIDSLRIKYELSLLSLSSLMDRYLILGFGPSNNINFYIGDNQHMLNLWKGGIIGFFIIQVILFKILRAKELGMIFYIIIFNFSITGNFLESTQIVLSLMIILWLLSKLLYEKKNISYY